MRKNLLTEPGKFGIKFEKENVNRAHHADEEYNNCFVVVVVVYFHSYIIEHTFTYF